MYPENAPTLPAIVKQAKWIWPDSHSWDLHNGYSLFRKVFTLNAVPKKAPLFITADQSYQLYLNGQYVCRGPARGFQKNWPYDMLNVSRWLKPGKNVIAVRAYHPGYSNFQYLSQECAGLLVAAKWGKTILVSDHTWRARRQTGIRKDMVQTSLQLFPQENIDLRLEDPDWLLPKCDDKAWTSPVVERIWNTMPWYSLEARGMPMLDEQLLLAGRIIGEADGTSAEDYLSTRNLSHTRAGEGLAHRAFEADTASFEIASSGQGKWRSVLIDLGKLHVGSTIVHVSGARGGEIVETHHYETINTKTLCPDYDTAAHCRMAFSQRLTCRSGEQEHRFYHTFGFRYMVLTVRDSESPLTLRLKLHSTLYPMERKGHFTSSDTELNAIWETCAWTEQVCSLDAYVDTPHREQAQWWGDARVQAWNTFHLSGDTRLFRRGIHQIASQATPNGVTYGHAPTMAHGCILPDFTLIWMLTLWDYYWQTGELEPFEAYQAQIKQALAYFEQWTDPKLGLLGYDHRYWLFLDWTGVRKEGFSTVYSLWYLHTLDRLAQLYTLTSEDAEARSCQSKARKLRTSLRKLINEDGLIRDGYTEKGEIDPETSVHSQTLAILTDLAPKHRKTMLEQRLVPYLRGEHKTDIHPSAYWITYVFQVLGENGYGQEVVADIRKRWLPMVAQGTTWENFDPVIANESFSHAWSAHPLFHLMQILGGIRQSAPGWTSVRFEPTFISESTDIIIPTPLGKLRAKWQKQDGEIRGKLRLPKGMEAEIKLPGQATVTVTGSYAFSLKT